METKAQQYFRGVDIRGEWIDDGFIRWAAFHTVECGDNGM
jgi:hypothetical protein